MKQIRLPRKKKRKNHNRDKMKESQPEEQKEEKKVDYTEQFRKTYFPHLAASK